MILGQKKVKVSMLPVGRYFNIIIGLSATVKVECLYRVASLPPSVGGEVVALLCKTVFWQGNIALLDRLYEGGPQGDLRLSFNPNMEVNVT